MRLWAVTWASGGKQCGKNESLHPSLSDPEEMVRQPQGDGEMENRIRMETLLSFWRNNVGGVYPVQEWQPDAFPEIA